MRLLRPGLLLPAMLLLASLWSTTADAAASGDAGRPRVAAETLNQQGPSAGDESQPDVVPMVLWTVVGIGAMVVVAGTLYLLKRRVGGFPKSPTWVAPISIERSSTFPDETASGDVPAAAHSGSHH